jgi:hypothetical protein
MHILLRLLVLASSSWLAACGEPHESGAAPASDLPERFALATEPSGAEGVLAAKARAEDGEPVVVRGRVQDFVRGLAALVITDGSLKPCDEEGPMSDCETPWDYCCNAPEEIAAASATVEFRDAGEVLRTDARGFHGLDRLKWVTVEGVSELDAQGNLTVVADGIYVRP